MESEVPSPCSQMPVTCAYFWVGGAQGLTLTFYLKQL